MAVDIQSMGSSLSIDQHWVDDAPKLFRSCSTISLSSSRSVANPFHAMGVTHRLRRKPARGFGLNHNARGYGTHGSGSTTVQKVHKMRAIGNVHIITRGSTSDELEDKLNKRLEDMRERFKQTRLDLKNVDDSTTLRPPFRNCSSEPADTNQAEFVSRKDSVSTTFKQTTYWSNFLRGVYPNSLSVDELLTKEDVSPDEFIYTSTVRELEAKDRDVPQGNDVPDDLVSERQTMAIGVDDVIISGDNENNSEDGSDSKDEWGPLSIPDSMNNAFDNEGHSNDISTDRTHTLEESVHVLNSGSDKRLLDMSDFQNEFKAMLKSDSDDQLKLQQIINSDEFLGVVNDSLVDNQLKGNVSSDSQLEINDKFEDVLKDLDKSYSLENLGVEKQYHSDSPCPKEQGTLGVEEQYHTDSPCPKEDMSDLSEAQSSVSLQSFDDQANGGSEVSLYHLGDRNLYESIEELSHL